MATFTFFSEPATPPPPTTTASTSSTSSTSASSSAPVSLPEFSWDKEYFFQPSFEAEKSYAIVNFETPIFCPTKSVFVASKLDVDISIL